MAEVAQPPSVITAVLLQAPSLTERRPKVAMISYKRITVHDREITFAWLSINGSRLLRASCVQLIFAQ